MTRYASFIGVDGLAKIGWIKGGADEDKTAEPADSHLLVGAFSQGFPLKIGFGVELIEILSGVANHVVDRHGFDIGNRLGHVGDKRRLITLAPVGSRGEKWTVRLNEAEAIATVKSVSVDDVIRHTTQNFYQLYAKADFEWEPLTKSTYR